MKNAQITFLGYMYNELTVRLKLLTDTEQINPTITVHCSCFSLRELPGQKRVRNKQQTSMSTTRLMTIMIPWRSARASSCTGQCSGQGSGATISNPDPPCVVLPFLMVRAKRTNKNSDQYESVRSVRRFFGSRPTTTLNNRRQRRLCAKTIFAFIFQRRTLPKWPHAGTTTLTMATADFLNKAGQPLATVDATIVAAVEDVATTTPSPRAHRRDDDDCDEPNEKVRKRLQELLDREVKLEQT